MHTVLSLLVGLSDVLTYVSVPAIIAALIFGRRHKSWSAAECRWQNILRWAGRIGVLFLAACLAFLMSNHAFGVGLDRLDYGLLAGVPTFLVAAFSASVIITVALLLGFALARIPQQRNSG